MQSHQFWTCPSALLPSHRNRALFLPLIPHLSFRLLLRSSDADPQLRHSTLFPKLPFSSPRLVLPPNLLRLISLNIFPIGKVSSIALLPDLSSILVFWQTRSCVIVLVLILGAAFGVIQLQLTST